MALENDSGDKIEAQVEISAPEMAETGNLTVEESLEKVKNLFVEGKRHLVCGNFTEAVDSFDECCRLSVKHYGELAMECADPYYYYGKSLLEQERTKEQKVIDVGEQKESEDSDDSEDEEEADKPTESNKLDTVAVDENEVPVDVVEQKGEVSNVQRVGEVIDQAETTENADKNGENGVVETSEMVADEVEEVDVEEAKDKNGSTLELAWEMVDLARVILEKQQPSDADTRLRLANCRMVLGEIHFAEEEFQGAVDEFKACLDLYGEILPPDDRKISEAYFQIGSSYDLENMFGFAAEFFKKAIFVLELRKSNLEKTLIDDVTMTDDNRETTKKEIDDLTTLIVDMTQRMNDTLDCDRQKIAAKQALDECTGKVNVEVNHANGDTGSNSEAADISHLVRKPAKRPGEEICDVDDEIKRTKIGNGDCKEIEGCATNGQEEISVQETTEAL